MINLTFAVDTPEDLSSASIELQRLAQCNTIWEAQQAFTVVPLPRNGHTMSGFIDTYSVQLANSEYYLRACKDCGHIIRHLGHSCHVCGFGEAYLQHP